MEHVGVYITNSANKTVELPVAPAEFTTRSELGGDTVTILGLGEIRRLGMTKLRTATISNNFPLDPANSPWCTAEELLGSSDDYISFFQTAWKKQKPVRLVVSGTNLNMTAVITAFEYGPGKSSTVDVDYTLEFAEYHEVKALKTVIKPVVAKKKAPRPKPAKKIGVGSTVIVNGRLHRDSYGAGPGQTEHNATRKINFTAPGRKCPYHVTTLSGGWRGWVTAGSVKAK
ncbi:hypothetical protein [Lacticaseibacillus sharpeae]|nr:hypothetical protein [Lacticaseibacillus sharpeae]